MTIDMTNNRVPYGLLDDDEWAALLAHEKAGGEFKCYCEGVWSKCDPSWSTEGIYRTVPLPLPLPLTQDVIAWDRLLDLLPGWIEWVVRDVHGAVFGYDKEPNLCGAEWAIDGRWDRVRISDYPGIVVQIGTVDWRESKQRRPRG
jgi:hypothetical protein